jgi:hypothetical protein
MLGSSTSLSSPLNLMPLWLTRSPQVNGGSRSIANYERLKGLNGNLGRSVEGITLHLALDEISWTLEPSGRFLVHSLYHKLCYGSIAKYLGATWEIKVFMWQLMLKQLPSNDNIQRCKVQAIVFVRAWRHEPCIILLPSCPLHMHFAQPSTFAAPELGLFARQLGISKVSLPLKRCYLTTPLISSTKCMHTLRCGR